MTNPSPPLRPVVELCKCEAAMLVLRTDGTRVGVVIGLHRATRCQCGHPADAHYVQPFGVPLACSSCDLDAKQPADNAHTDGEQR